MNYLLHPLPSYSLHIYHTLLLPLLLLFYPTHSAHPFVTPKHHAHHQLLQENICKLPQDDSFVILLRGMRKIGMLTDDNQFFPFQPNFVSFLFILLLLYLNYTIFKYFYLIYFKYSITILHDSTYILIYIIFIFLYYLSVLSNYVPCIWLIYVWFFATLI